MKRLEVKVCVCTQCVMNGAMEIVESIESLQELKNQLRFDTSVDVNAGECLCDHAKGDFSPLVIVNGERIEKATSEMVMSRILAMSAKE